MPTRFMGEQATRAILDPAFKHGKIPPAIIPINEIQRTIAVFAIERFRVGPLVAGKKGAIQVLTKTIISRDIMSYFFHNRLSIKWGQMCVQPILRG
jgi:hypothetical protein